MYQCFSRNLSSHDVAPTDGIAAVQYCVSRSGDETKIGHRSSVAELAGDPLLRRGISGALVVPRRFQNGLVRVFAN